MKKIKITEKQAQRLGLKPINEMEDTGIKSVGTSIGEKIVRVVISGQSVPNFKDRILQLILRHDPQANVGFFDTTGKIVGNIKDIKLTAIKRDLKSLDPTIELMNKPLIKSLKENGKRIKLTQEQYNRLISSNNINEQKVNVVGGLNRVDKSFKKEIPNLKENVSDLKSETINLIKYLYRKSEDLSPFWSDNGLTYDDICKKLLDKNIIIKKEGKYELSKSLGSPQAAIQAVEDELSTLIPQEAQNKQLEPSLETEDSNTPAGADNDSNAPWNEKEADSTEPVVPSEKSLEVVGMNSEIAILKSPDQSLYVFYYHHLDRNDFAQYASLTRHYVGKDEDGEPEYDYDKDFEITPDVISNYVNDNIKTLRKGDGLNDYESGNFELVKIDEPLKNDLASLYDKDNDVLKVIGGVKENSEDEAFDKFKDNIVQAYTPIEKKPESPEAKKSRIVAKLSELKKKEEERQQQEKVDIANRQKSAEVDETTSASSAGAFSAPLTTNPVKKVIPDVPVSEGPKDELGKGYTHFAIYKPTNKIVNGWDYKGIEPDEIKHWAKIDIHDQFPDKKFSDFKVVGRGFLLKNNIDPTNTENWFKNDISETTTVASAGNFQYDAPGLANIGRNGEFKKGPKTKAQKSTQYAGGSFVEMDECTKLNNNKKAQNGGCNQGAVDGVVKQIKSSSSVISPSLDESIICKVISQKTGKTIEEVKLIIASKNTIQQ